MDLFLAKSLNKYFVILKNFRFAKQSVLIDLFLVKSFVYI